MINNTVQIDRRLMYSVATPAVWHFITEQINPKGCIELMIPLVWFAILQIYRME